MNQDESNTNVVTDASLCCVVGKSDYKGDIDLVNSPTGGRQVGNSAMQNSANVVIGDNASIEKDGNELCPLYDHRLAGIEDKFVSTILSNVSTRRRPNDADDKAQIFLKWQQQSDFEFGFIPRSEQVMPEIHEIGSPQGLSILEIHALIKATGVPNYMQARIPIQSQLNVKV